MDLTSLTLEEDYIEKISVFFIRCNKYNDLSERNEVYPVNSKLVNWLNETLKGAHLLLKLDFLDGISLFHLYLKHHLKFTWLKLTWLLTKKRTENKEVTELFFLCCFTVDSRLH